MAQGLPFLIAVITVPLIIKGMGIDRFSILALLWIIIGYSNLFDFGLGRALTQLISKNIALKKTEDISSLIWTALIIVFTLGVIASLFLCLLSPFIIHNIIKLPDEYYDETIKSLYLLAATLPLFLVFINIRGVLEAYQKFNIVTLLRIPVVLFNYIGPLFILPFSNNIFHIVILLVFGRVVTFAFYILACYKFVDGFSMQIRFDKKHLKPLFSFGGWITVSNIVGPLTCYMDRFFIANIIAAIVVAYYTVPYDVITRMTIIPIAILGVMFPAFSSEYQTNIKRTKRMYFKTMLYTSVITIVPVIILVIFAKWGLGIWISPEFAENSFAITQLIAIGAFVEVLNQSPLSLIQGTGRADITGKIILFVLPVYLILLLWFIDRYGLIGAAMAWLSRACLDFIILHFFAIKLLNPEKAKYEKN